MKTLEDERHVVIKAYKCTVSKIWRDFFVLAYIACPDSMIYWHSGTFELVGYHATKLYTSILTGFAYM